MNTGKICNRQIELGAYEMNLVGNTTHKVVILENRVAWGDPCDGWQATAEWNRSLKSSANCTIHEVVANAVHLLSNGA